MNHLRILIADDDPIIRLDLKQMLENLDYVVIAEAGDGQTALQLAKSLTPDICILDVKMPLMDGIEVAQQLIEFQISPTLLLTAYGDKELIQRAKDAGVFGYLVKPFKASDLVPAIELARSRYEENVQLAQEVQNLEEKLEARKVIDQAKGYLMKKFNLSEPDAYRRIQIQSMQTRRSMKEMAEAILLARDIDKK